MIFWTRNRNLDYQIINSIVIFLNSTIYLCFCVYVTDQKMYWGSTGDRPSIEMAFLNGSERTPLFTESSAQYTGITLLYNSLYISDSLRRYTVLYSVTSTT